MKDFDDMQKDVAEEKEINLGDDFFMDDVALGDDHEDPIADADNVAEEDDEM